jgi:hypothetical protein
MAEGQRTTRFGARIALERRFLTPVNSTFGPVAPLAGMTEDAISSWSERAGAHFGVAAVAPIAEVLLETARRAKLLVDDSREVFDPAIRKLSGIDGLLEVLQGRLSLVAGSRR